MTSSAFTPAWSPSDCDTAALWAESGAQWLTASGVPVPDRLIREVVGMVAMLDESGAHLGALSGAQGVGLLAERAAIMGTGPAGTASAGGASKLMPSRDGWLAVTLSRDDDIMLLPAWLGVDVDHQGVPWLAVEKAVASRRSRDVVADAIDLSLACSSLGEVTDRRGVLAEKLGDALPRPLQGMTVVNLAALWAGPLAAHVLHRLGAHVIGVESITRPDGARAVPAFFGALHDGVETVQLPLHLDEGWDQLKHLVATADVVIEGSRPRVLAQRGLDARAITASGPRVWVSITAYGRREPDDLRVGFGDDAAVAGGLVGWWNERPVFLADAVADPLTGLTAAATVVQLVRTGGRWLTDIALTRVAASCASQPEDPIIEPRHASTPPMWRR